MPSASTAMPATAGQSPTIKHLHHAEQVHLKQYCEEPPPREIASTLYLLARELASASRANGYSTSAPLTRRAPTTQSGPLFRNEELILRIQHRQEQISGDTNYPGDSTRSHPLSLFQRRRRGSWFPFCPRRRPTRRHPSWSPYPSTSHFDVPREATTFE